MRVITLLLAISMLFACSKQEAYFQGYIEGELTYMASPASGELIELVVQRGDEVRATQLLFRLDPQPHQAMYTEAQQKLTRAQANLADLQKGKRPTEIAAVQASLEQAEAELTLAELTYERNKVLYAKQVVQKQILDEANAAYLAKQETVERIRAELATARQGAREDQIRIAEAELAAAQAALQQAEWWLSQKQVKAPVNAQVVDTFFRVGEQVAANQAVLSLLAPQDVSVIFFIPENLLSKLHTGMQITIDCDACEKTYPGNVAFISPQQEYTPPIIYSRESRQKLVYRIKAALPHEVAKQFNPGQPVDITVRF
jgi:HlyD family secretion protein